jgi:CheY-like chemotaxis protein
MDIKLLVVEENFLSLSQKDLHGASVISQYSYFGEVLYSFISAKKNPKVLIVEDDDISIILLRAMLKDEKCDIDVAKNGGDGFELLKKALDENVPYDVVYTDKNMPVLSGDKMVEKYRKIEQSTGIKRLSAVCISGNAGADQDSLCYFDFFATKPFKKQDILSIFFDSIGKYI